jgi:hypothetical protein
MGRAAVIVRIATIAFAVAILAPAAAAAPVLGANVDFEQPELQATITTLHAEVTFSSSERPRRVELLTRNRFEDSWFAQEAEIRGGSGRYTALVDNQGHRVPNTPLGYRFRVTTSSDTVLSEERQLTVVDERFAWRVREGKLVRLHWYEGSDEFARRALEIGEKAVNDVSKLLGVTESEPIDFFVYASLDAFRRALGPGTPENAAGQANTSIRTLFALIQPAQINSDWVDEVIPHELAHLVFNTAVANPYHSPPRWLNEGLAVYLSEGYGGGDKARIAAAVSRRSLIPLDGLRAQFPTSSDRFFLSYAESVSAVDFFIRTYGQPTLVKLVRSYANGVTDDEAFRAATGADVAAFNAAWFADIGAALPQAVGPQPGPPGPLPSDWTSSPRPSGAATPPGAPSGSPARTSPRQPVFVDSPAIPGTDDGTSGPITLAAVVLLAAVLLVVGVKARRRRPRSLPPSAPPGPPHTPPPASPLA